ncbi:MAG TPA: LysR family transcriptional regulator, partial [Phormidium sp.]
MNEINKSRMKLSQIRALVAVADYGNFSEAALQLEVSQSAISHAIASFEEELGVVLLARGRYGARLTPVGERVTAHARKLLQLLEAMEKEANLEKGLQGGNVRVACFRSVATHILPTAIARFRACFPNITVSIVDGDDYSRVGDALRAGYADIGFIYLPAGNEFETWEILRDDYVLLLPPTTNLSNAKVTWKQLATYPLIISSGIPCNEWIRKYLVIAEY